MRPFELGFFAARNDCGNSSCVAFDLFAAVRTAFFLAGAFFLTTFDCDKVIVLGTLKATFFAVGAMTILCWMYETLRKVRAMMNALAWRLPKGSEARCPKDASRVCVTETRSRHCPRR
jgi:hypothetical protein